MKHFDAFSGYGGATIGGVSAFLNNDWGRKPKVKLPSLF